MIPALPPRSYAKLGAAGLLLATGALLLGPIVASSHREAPLISELPKVDGSDFYMFNSYEPGREDFVVLIANYLPLQDPGGGPNYFRLDPEARYEINLDNDGDALEDITFRFGFNNFLKDISLPIGDPGNEKDVSVPLSFVGPISATDSSALNVIEWYSAGVVIEDAAGTPSRSRPSSPWAAGCRRRHQWTISVGWRRPAVDTISVVRPGVHGSNCDTDTVPGAVSGQPDKMHRAGGSKGT